MLRLKVLPVVDVELSTKPPVTVKPTPENVYAVEPVKVMLPTLKLLMSLLGVKMVALPLKTRLSLSPANCAALLHPLQLPALLKLLLVAPVHVQVYGAAAKATSGAKTASDA